MTDLQNSTSTTGKNKLVVDRENTVPFLLRMFWQQGAHHRPEDYTPDHLPTENEIQLYTWKDATLKEIANLIKEVNFESTRSNARISFKLVYIDNLRGKYAFKDLGTVYNMTSTSDDDINLDDARFVIGDFLDVGVFHGVPPRVPERRGSILKDRNRDRDRARNSYRNVGNERRDRDRERDRNNDRRDDRRDGSFRDRRR
ncbi:Sin3 associated polypeptide p18-domain-containing protein [Gigaspora rosea]|uniref:Sin3 associated polypeptide p18-domain-containing protein n=2 Tax=Gigaspora TaxID=4873 RepID=A0A397W763_9GLOM|nr:SAP18-domain-containing protein [Gigaspora margarita]RIB30530.1 Sin3 associated polypeptide p18-domain-containing protein [Gigaspora rosea]